MIRENFVRIVLLEIAFVPLYLLGILCLGIPYIWITPYHLAANAQLYLDMKKEYNLKYSDEFIES